MELLTIIPIAIGLAMDAFAVSVVCTATYRRLNIKHILRMAFFFGTFQAFMPIIGYFAARGVIEFIRPYDQWLAFMLLVAVGGRMIYESFNMNSAQQNMSPSQISVLLVLSLATSLDALFVGFSLSLLVESVTLAIILIGVITFILSLIGAEIGKRLGHFFENWIETIGGGVLIAIGIKILFEHFTK